MRVEVVTQADEQFQRAANDLAPAVARATNSEAEKITAEGRGKVERRSGRAAGSVRTIVNGNETTITAGAGVPYWHWLRFGGAVGRRHAVRRPVVQEGRYFPTRVAIERRMVGAVEDAVEGVVRKAGL